MDDQRSRPLPSGRLLGACLLAALLTRPCGALAQSPYPTPTPTPDPLAGIPVQVLDQQ